MYLVQFMKPGTIYNHPGSIPFFKRIKCTKNYLSRHKIIFARAQDEEQQTSQNNIAGWGQIMTM